MLIITVALSSCSDEKYTPPKPVDIFLDTSLKSLFCFGKDSYWIYESSDGKFDTVNVTSARIDTIKYVDDHGSLISRQEYFFIDMISSYKKTDFRVYRHEVAPSNPSVIVNIIYSGLGGHINFKYPFDHNTTYYGTSGNLSDQLVVLESGETTIDNESHNFYRVKYTNLQEYDFQDVEIIFVSGIGLYSVFEVDTGRAWSLKFYDIK